MFRANFSKFRVFSLLFLSLLVLSCNNQEHTPKWVLSKPIFRDLLVEVHLIDGYFNYLSNDTLAQTKIKALYKTVFDKYQIDSLRFAQNLQYYYAHPQQLQIIYKEVDSLLVRKRDSVQLHQKQSAL